MKKFDLRGVKEVFANLRGGEKVSSKGDSDVQESLQPHDFFCGKVSFATTHCQLYFSFVSRVTPGNIFNIVKGNISSCGSGCHQ